MWKNLLLLCITLLLTVIAVEFGMQQFTHLPGGLGEGRYLYYSENPWRKISTADDWVVTLQTHADIRSYASYGGEVEYDYRLETNRLGFRRTLCMEKQAGSLIPVLGDSYTQGTGGFNWLNRSNDQVSASGSPYCYMNAAVAATGFESWIRQIDFMSILLNPPFQVVVFIADDIARVHFFARESGNRIELCYMVEGDQGAPVERCSSLPIFTGEGDSEFVGDVPQKGFLQRALPASSNLVSRALRSGEGQAGGRFGTHEDLEKRLIRNLGRLEEAYDGRILVIRIPSKTDLLQGYQPFTGVKDSDHLEYREADCGLDHGDFHRNDEHPNHAGYGKIADCVAAEIMGFEARHFR